VDGISQLKIVSTNLTLPQHWADGDFIDAIAMGKSKTIGDADSHTLLKKSVSGAVCKSGSRFTKAERAMRRNTCNMPVTFMMATGRVEFTKLEVIERGLGLIGSVQRSCANQT
jgi:hypothetical protein